MNEHDGKNAPGNGADHHPGQSDEGGKVAAGALEAAGLGDIGDHEPARNPPTAPMIAPWMMRSKAATMETKTDGPPHHSKGGSGEVKRGRPYGLGHAQHSRRRLENGCHGGLAERCLAGKANRPPLWLGIRRGID
ncbi:hypothetical protein [Mesorhizobium sp. ES1-4]|uniref:hypothetical protein n=1 Tax=Mesorhizobium sp. ES1-4 TaxID=2876627 RepID=UPI001CCDE289|nr:hypothetical protein [Mesorhizobium sp. ES1-4]MBZ9795071.1 hypothetical protein [Mesorhizobium sp. ES1-4]